MYSLAESQVWCVQKSFFPIEILLFANSNRSKNVLGFFFPLNACIITAYEGLESSWLVQSDILEEGDLQSGPSGTVIPWEDADASIAEAQYVIFILCLLCSLWQS